MKSFLQFINKHKVTIIAVLIVLIAISPMLVFFNHAIVNTDDFLYGRYAREEYQTSHNVLSTIQVAFERVKHDYFTWQGTYSSLFMMSLQPDVFSIKLYRLSLMSMFILSLFSQALVAYTLNKYFLKADSKYISIILCAYFITITQLMPSIYEAYYWFNGSIHYQFGFSLICLFIAGLVKFTYSQKKLWRIVLFVLLVLLLIYIGGSNYPLGLIFAMGLAMFALFNFIKKVKDKYYYVALFIIYLVFFLINVLAPGNGMRATEYESLSLINVGLFSIRDMIMEVPKWSLISLTLPVMLLLVPNYKKIVADSKIKFVHPSIAAIAIALFYLAQYVPVMYGLGSKGPLRIENIRFMTLQISFILLIINALGYCYQKNVEINFSIFTSVIIVFVLLCMSLSTVAVNEYTSYKMIDMISSGELTSFSQQQNQVMETLSDLNIPTEEITLPNDIANDYLHPNKIYWGDYRVLKYYLR